MNKSFLAFFFIICAFSVHAQKSIIFSGIIMDEDDQPIPSASVEIYSENKRLSGSITNDDGLFSISLLKTNATITILVNHLGFTPYQSSIDVQSDSVYQSITLLTSFSSLPSIVVSAARTEQRLEETTTSITAVPSSLIKNKNPTDVQQTVDQVPGVHVTEGQVNIRSGSGWSYGAGTRVLTLIDDLPLISPDANQILWPLVPFESMEQMEVLKGASSAMYGSSAMNGVINVRTRSPFTKKTYVNSFSGFYDAPTRPELKWWDTPQHVHGLQASHSDFIDVGKGKFGYLLGVNGLWDSGFRWKNMDNRARMHWKTAYKQPMQNNGVLEFGLNGSISHRKSGQALIWEGPNRAYIAQDSSVTITEGTTYFIDPYIEMRYGNDDIIHSDKLQMRFLGINNAASDNINVFDNASQSMLMQYQHQATFKGATITAGVFGLFADTKSELFGIHSSSNQAVFIQADFPWKRFNFSAGARYEIFMVNDLEEEKPVYRAGINYRLFKHTNIFTNYGEGFRFPSIAELYTQTNIGAINIYPGQNLRPEFGRTAELGIKQIISNGNSFSSRFELTAYVMQFDDMIEFMFAQWGAINPDNPFDGLGFSSINIGAVRISGYEISYAGEVTTKKSKWQFLTGYTYANPIALNPNDQIIEGQQLTYISSSSDTINTLKYRFQHLLRADLQYVWKNKVKIGGSARYNDFMQAVDQAFIAFLPGVRATRERLNSGDMFIDLRVGYIIKKGLSFNLICDNLLNREYMIRPAMLGMPRRYMVQMQLEF